MDIQFTGIAICLQCEDTLSKIPSYRSTNELKTRLSFVVYTTLKLTPKFLYVWKKEFKST